VVPLRKGFEEGRYFLVLFEEGPAKPRRAHAKGPLGVWPGWLRGRAQKTVSRTDPARLECELDAARNHLRAIFTAYESVQEELKSSREKLRSAQEEFQSANEELDTAKEELQAANEELVAANTELQLRNQELSRINADLREARDYAQAIVDTTQDALLVLDPELKVRRANRAFLELFRVPREAVEHHLLSDVGQGVWSLTGLLNQIRRVALGGEPIENLEWTLDIPSQGSWILVSNACRLVGEANLSGLVLLSIRDVTEQRSAEAMLKQQADLLDQAHEAILIWTLGGAIRYWNRGAEELYGWRREEALGKVSHALLKMRTGISYEEFIRKLRADGQWIGESVHTTRSGEELVVESHRTVQEQSDGSWLVFETNRDITKRKQMEQSLLQADRQKDEFLAMLAHELRNPLAPLRNALSILHRSNPNQLPIEKLLTMMDRQVLKLARIVDDLLDAARITRGQIELRKERVDLAVLINHAIEPIKPQLKALTQKLSVALPKTPVLIEADPIRVEQVIENLLSNAVKYTPPGGRIGIALETIDDKALVRVDDNGKGIGPDVLPKVFDLFIQADHGLDRQPGGLGIGLTLVRRLVELHGGSVEASSAGPGLGSQFIVKLPLATITEPPDPTPPKAPSGRLSALDSPA
jgi:two-component system CheB/CheR fusion protein